MVLAAVGFLTRLPVAGAVVDGPGAAAFPLVGTAIGAVGGVGMLLVGPREPVLAAILAVGTIALLSGGLHLDGLSDTADALATPDPAGAERARRDPSAGAAGTTALILLLGAQVASLASLASSPNGSWLAAAACIAAGAVSRGMPVVMAAAARTLVRPDGSAGWFVASVTMTDVVVAVGSAVGVVAALAALTARPEIVAGVVAGTLAAAAVIAFVLGARRQLDGDVFGAGVELTAVAVLAAIAVVA